MVVGRKVYPNPLSSDAGYINTLENFYRMEKDLRKISIK